MNLAWVSSSGRITALSHNQDLRIKSKGKNERERHSQLRTLHGQHRHPNMVYHLAKGPVEKYPGYERRPWEPAMDPACQTLPRVITSRPAHQLLRTVGQHTPASLTHQAFWY